MLTIKIYMITVVFVFIALTVCCVINSSQSEQMVNRHIVQQVEIFKSIPTKKIVKAEVNPDGRSIALLLESDEGYVVNYNGKSSMLYKDVEPRYLMFSPNGVRFCYQAAFDENGEYKGHPVIDGKVISTPGEIADDGVAFSPDGKHFAYAEKYKGKWRMIIDGKPCPLYELILKGSFTFSPDSKRYAYKAIKAKGKSTVIVDGREDPIYQRVGFSELSFSPDSKHYNYFANVQGKCRLIIDGQPAPIPDPKWEVFCYRYSPDSQHLAYYIVGQDDFKMVVDGNIEGSHNWLGDLVPLQESKRPELDYIEASERNLSLMDKNLKRVNTISFSPDSQHLVYCAGVGDDKLTFIKDGKSGDQWDGMGIFDFAFSPNSERFAYIGVKNRQCYPAIDGNIEGPYPSISLRSLTFSPDSKHVAYTAINKDKKLFVVLDGKEEPAYIDASPPCFSPDSQAMAYVAFLDGDKATVVVNGQTGKKYSYIYTKSLRFDSNDRFHYLAVEDDTIFLVEESINTGNGI